MRKDDSIEANFSRCCDQCRYSDHDEHGECEIRKAFEKSKFYAINHIYFRCSEFRDHGYPEVDR
jgi:hypothetical protein